MEPLLTLPGEGEHCLEAGGTKVIVMHGEPWDSPQKGQGGVWAGLQSWLLFDLLGGRECRPKALPQSTCTKVVPSEPWAAGTESREVCSGLELAWILPLDALLAHQIILTLGSSRLSETVLVMAQYLPCLRNQRP